MEQRAQSVIGTVIGWLPKWPRNNTDPEIRIKQDYSSPQSAPGRLARSDNEIRTNVHNQSRDSSVYTVLDDIAFDSDPQDEFYDVHETNDYTDTQRIERNASTRTFQLNTNMNNGDNDHARGDFDRARNADRNRGYHYSPDSRPQPRGKVDARSKDPQKYRCIQNDMRNDRVDMSVYAPRDIHQNEINSTVYKHFAPDYETMSINERMPHEFRSARAHNRNDDDTHPIYLAETYNKPYIPGLYDDIDNDSRQFGVRQRYPQLYDSNRIEWSDYLTHFLAIAELNHWSNKEMAKQLMGSADANSMKIFNEFGKEIRNNFHKMAYALNQRFDPKERAEALKIEFKHRKRNGTESLPSFAQELKKLAAKAYYKLSSEAQQEWVLDQFINGLNSDHLEDHVRLSHPHDIDHAVSLAIEYEAIKASKSDKIRKPSAELNAIHNNSSNELQKMKNEILGEVRRVMNQNQPRNNYNSDQNRFAPAQQVQSNQYTGRNYNAEGNRNAEVCQFCWKPGHLKNQCWKLQAKIERDQYLQSNFTSPQKVYPQNNYQNQQNTNFGGNQTYRQQNTHMQPYNTYNVGQNNMQGNSNKPFRTTVHTPGPSGN